MRFESKGDVHSTENEVATSCAHLSSSLHPLCHDVVLLPYQSTHCRPCSRGITVKRWTPGVDETPAWFWILVQASLRQNQRDVTPCRFFFLCWKGGKQDKDKVAMAFRMMPSVTASCTHSNRNYPIGIHIWEYLDPYSYSNWNMTIMLSEFIFNHIPSVSTPRYHFMWKVVEYSYWSAQGAIYVRNERKQGEKISSNTLK